MGGAASAVLKLVIDGNSKGAVGAVDRFGKSTTGAGSTASRAFSVIRKGAMMAVAGVVALAAGALLVFNQLKKCVGVYVEWGKANLKLTSQTGIAGKAVTRLATQWRLSGIETDRGTAAVKMFSRVVYKTFQDVRTADRHLQNLDKTSKTYNEDLAKAEKALRQTQGPFRDLGVNLRDNEGKLRSTGDLLAEVRSRFSQLEPGARRTALAMQFFGKSGADLLPWLTKSNKEIDRQNQLLKMSGLVWDKDARENLKKYIVAGREMSFLWDALKLKLGQTVVPYIVKHLPQIWAGFNRVRDVIVAGFGWLDRHSGDINHALDLAAKGIAFVWRNAKDLGVTIASIFAVGKITQWSLAVRRALKGLAVSGIVAGGGGAAASGAAGSAAGWMFGGAVPTVGANVASAGTVSGAARANAAITASRLGGAGTSLGAMLAAAAPAIATAAAVAAGIVVAGGVAEKILGKQEPAFRAPGATNVRGATTGTMTGRYGSAYGTGATVGRTTKNVIAALEVRGATANAAEFRNIIAQIAALKKIAKDPIILGDLNAKHTNAQLRSIRDRIKTDLGLTRKQADNIMNLMFKDWRPQRTISGKLTPAVATALAKFRQIREAAARDIKMGRVDNTGVINSLAQIVVSLGNMEGAARSAAEQLARATTGGHGGYMPLAAGGDFVARGPMHLLVGEAGPERVSVTPLSRSRTTTGGMAGAPTVIVQVNAPVFGVDHLFATIQDAVDAAFGGQELGGIAAARG